MTTIGLAGMDGGAMAESARSRPLPVGAAPTASTASRSRTSPSITCSGTWCTRCSPTTAAALAEEPKPHEVRRRVPRSRRRRRCCSRDRGAGRAHRDVPPAAAANHGGLRRPHPLDLQLRHRDHAARRHRARARPRLPGLRAADGPGRRLRGAGRARRSVIFTTFGDAMRVPGSKKSLLRPRPTAPTCAWSIRRSTRSTSPASNPDREVVFFGARLRDHHAEHRPDRAAGRARGHQQLLALLQPHHHHPDDQGDPRFARAARSTAFWARATSAW